MSGSKIELPLTRGRLETAALEINDTLTGQREGGEIADVRPVIALLLAISEASRKQAQAPLLEALREAERCLTHLPTSWGADSELEKIRAAIAQAGEERE